MNFQLPALALTCLLTFAAAFCLVYFGWPYVGRFIERQTRRYDTVLNRELLLNIPPRLAVYLSGGIVLLTGLIAAGLGREIGYFLIGALVGLFIPNLLISHFEAKRKEKLEQQLVDGITSLASGVRAGLNLVQSMEVLVQNQTGPIKQEFANLLREYSLGVDLNVAMRHTSDRIALRSYRLLFAAIEAHRQRGGDMGESLDRIAEAVREIQRLEGRLQTLTAQGRWQARFMAAMPVVILGIMYLIVPDDVTRLFVEPGGRLLLLIAAGLIAAGFFWIRSIMEVDV